MYSPHPPGHGFQWGLSGRIAPKVSFGSVQLFLGQAFTHLCYPLLKRRQFFLKGAFPPYSHSPFDVPVPRLLVNAAVIHGLNGP
jgi:hypothetical protein